MPGVAMWRASGTELDSRGRDGYTSAVRGLFRRASQLMNPTLRIQMSRTISSIHEALVRHGPGPGAARASILLFLSLALSGPWQEALGQEVDPGQLAALTARSIGPAGMSGRIAAIEAVASDPNIVFVGAATGGVWKSVNGGQTWKPVFDDQPLLGVGAVSVFQGNPDIVWVGTGEGNPRNSAGVGAGLYKSLDGGDTWSFLGLGESERIHRIVLHPDDPDVAYVGVMGPAWSDGTERGVYRTRDGGGSWERVLFVDRRTGISDLVMDPSNPDHLLAGMWEFRRWPWFFQSGGQGSGIFVTYDGGDEWTRLTSAQGLPEGELGRIGLAFASSEPDVAYALVEATRSALLRSNDGGSTWQTVNDQEGVAPRPFYFTDIFVDPTNELRLFNLHSRLERSEDGGRTFQEMAEGVHSDCHALWIDPSDSRLMFVGTDGGLYVSRDRGDRWRFVDNLPVGQFYHVSVDMDIPFNIYGGMQDNGSWRGPSDVWETGGIRNHRWTEVGFGDGFGTLIDPMDPSVGYSMSQGGGLVRFDLRTGERKGIRPWAPEGVELRFNWNAALAADPLNPGVLYYGSQFVHRTRDRGQSWQIISGDLTTNDPEKQRQAESGGLTRDATGAENHTTILTIAPSPVEPEVIWVGSDDGLVHVTRSGGGDWVEVGEDLDHVPEGAWISHIEASGQAGGKAYVVVDDHRRGNWRPYIFRTEDYGRHWRNIADEDQIRGFVHTLEEDPINPNLLFAGTEFGMYVSLDGGDDWFLWRHGLPPAPVRSIVVHPRDHDLVVGTHGRGIYVVDDIRPLRALAENPALLFQDVHLFQPPPAYLRGEAAADGYHFPGDAMFRGQTRPRGALLTYAVGPSEQAGEATIQILDSSGAVVRTLVEPVQHGLNRTVWDLREESPGQEGGGGRYAPVGLEVLPGAYQVTVRAGESESSATLEVLPDPRVEIPMEERVLKRQALRRAMEILRVADDLGRGLMAMAQGLDQVREALLDRRDPVGTRLATMADSLDARLEPLEEGLGRVYEDRRALLAMGQSRDAPTEADGINLIRAGEALDRVIDGYNTLVTGEIQSFRQALGNAGLTLLPQLDPVLRNTGGGEDPG